MVAQVIKLPSVATNNFKITSLVESAPREVTQNTQESETNSRQITEQAEENIQVIRDAAKNLNEFAEKIQTNLSFSVDEGTGRSVITVTDTQTGDVIRQIPAKEILAVANLLRESTASDIERVGLLLAEQG